MNNNQQIILNTIGTFTTVTFLLLLQSSDTQSFLASQLSIYNLNLSIYALNILELEAQLANNPGDPTLTAEIAEQNSYITYTNQQIPYYGTSTPYYCYALCKTVQTLYTSILSNPPDVASEVVEFNTNLNILYSFITMPVIVATMFSDDILTYIQTTAVQTFLASQLSICNMNLNIYTVNSNALGVQISSGTHNQYIPQWIQQLNYLSLTNQQIADLDTSSPYYCDAFYTTIQTLYTSVQSNPDMTDVVQLNNDLIALYKLLTVPVNIAQYVQIVDPVAAPVFGSSEINDMLVFLLLFWINTTSITIASTTYYPILSSFIMYVENNGGTATSSLVISFSKTVSFQISSNSTLNYVAPSYSTLTTSGTKITLPTTSAPLTYANNTLGTTYVSINATTTNSSAYGVYTAYNYINNIVNNVFNSTPIGNTYYNYLTHSSPPATPYSVFYDTIYTSTSGASYSFMKAFFTFDTASTSTINFYRYTDPITNIKYYFVFLYYINNIFLGSHSTYTTLDNSNDLNIEYAIAHVLGNLG